MSVYHEWTEGFAIFEKYPDDLRGISSQYDIVYSGPDPEKVSPEDVAALDALGWHADDGNACFYKFT